MLYFLIGCISIVLSFLFFKPFWKRYNLKILFLLLFPISILIYWIVNYSIINKEPTSFRAAVELLKNDSLIVNEIGGYESYSYFEKDMPDEDDNPAFVKLSLKGPVGELYLSCKLVRDTYGRWNLVYIKQDSLGTPV